MSGSAPDPDQAEMFAPDGAESSERHVCRMCGTRLRRRQLAFCSDQHRKQWWDLRFPRMNRWPEGPREGSIQSAILGVLMDGEWWTKSDLAVKVRAHEHSVGTRLSELRRKGFRIESDAKVGNVTRAHRFRLVL